MPKENYNSPTPLYIPTRKFILGKVNRFINSGNVLELGVSTGEILLQIKNEEKLGIDFDEERLGRATESGIKTIKHDLNYGIPLENESFSNILCIETLEHMARYKKVLEESYRVLKSGGVFLVVVPYHGMIKNVLLSLFNIKHFQEEAHCHFFVPKLLKRDLESIGFKILDIDKFGRFPYLWRVFSIVCQKP